MNAHYLTDAEIAGLFHVSRRTVQNRCRSKAWPHLRIAGRYLFTTDHVARIEALSQVGENTTTTSTATTRAANAWGRVTRTA